MVLVLELEVLVLELLVNYGLVLKLKKKKDLENQQTLSVRIENVYLCDEDYSRL